MLNIKSVNAAIKADAKLSKKYLKTFDTDCYVKKFSRLDSVGFSGDDGDVVVAMIFAGIVNADATPLFESVEQISNFSSARVNDLFSVVNEYNSEDMESEGKKS